MTPMKWFLTFLKKYRIYMIVGIILTILITALHLVNPYISGLIVDDVIKGGAYDMLFPLVGCMIKASCAFSTRLYLKQPPRAFCMT